jgi:hypothetical protein
MESTNTGGSKDKMAQDRSKEQDAGKKTGQQPQGGSSQNWKPHDDEETESTPSSGSIKQSDTNRAGGQQYPGGQSSPSRQSGQSNQSNQSGPSNNPAK